MPSVERIEQITFGPGQKGRRERVPVVLGAAHNAKERRSVIFNRATPARRRTAKRFMPWSQDIPIVGAFYGDGEAIDFAAGSEDKDWRRDDSELDETDYNNLDDMAAREGLMKAQGRHNSTASIWWPISTGIAGMGVLFALITFLAYAESRGGFGAVFGGIGG